MINDEYIKKTIEQINHAPTSQGKNYLLKYYSGQKLTNRQRIIAKCCDCSGYYVDGLKDCCVEYCVNYPVMPYGKVRVGLRRGNGKV